MDQSDAAKRLLEIVSQLTGRPRPITAGLDLREAFRAIIREDERAE